MLSERKSGRASKRGSEASGLLLHCNVEFVEPSPSPPSHPVSRSEAQTMGSDPYCFICGGNAHVARIVLSAFQRSAEAKHIPAVDSESVKQFLFDDADRQFYEDLVSIGPYDSKDEPLIEPIYNSGKQAEIDRLNAVDLDSIRMIEDLVPGSLHDLGGLERREGPGYFNLNPATYPFGHALCFRLLAAFAPRLMQPVSNYWATIRVLNGPKTTWPRCVNGVDFGDVAGSHEQYVWPFHKFGRPSDNDDEEDELEYEEDELPREIRVALAKDTLDPTDLFDYWLTKGCMYVWVRPDKFPVRRAFDERLQLLSCKSRSRQSGFADLPLDVLLPITHYVSLREALSLLSLCTALREKLLNCVDTIAREHLTWAAPATADEQLRWEDILKQADASSKSFPCCRPSSKLPYRQLTTMGGDTYCYICGGHKCAPQIVNWTFETSAELGHIPVVDSEKVKQFLFHDEDIAFLEDFVPIGPYDQEDEPRVEAVWPEFPRQRYAEKIKPLTEDIDLNTIRMVQNLVVGSFTDWCDLERRPGDESGNFRTISPIYPFGHALCFRLLAAFTPRVMQPVGKFWATIRACDDTSILWPPTIWTGVDLGDVIGSQQQWAEPFHAYYHDVPDGQEATYPNDDEDLPMVLKAVLNKEVLDPVDLRDYWLNKGCMYVWARPDRFPVHEAFEEPVHLMSCNARSGPTPFADLPLDVLLDIGEYLEFRDVISLLRLCTTLRAKLLGCMDWLARRCSAWAVPLAPGEQDRWDASLAQVDAASRSQPFPWLAARPLRSSLNMARPVDSAAASVALDWSTSYQASASASAGIYEGDSVEEDEDSESDAVLVRGRPATPATPTLLPSAPVRIPGRRGHAATSSSASQSSVGHVKSLSGTLTRRARSLLRSRTAAASRSRSPKPSTPVPPPDEIPRHPSPVALLKSTTASSKVQPAPKPPYVAVLPTAFRLHFNMPFTRLAFDFVIDVRSAGEAALLLFAVTLAASRFCLSGEELWVPLELTSIIALSLLYVFASHILSMLSAPTNN
ncbi:hypothetical protein AURDEDRAFT_150751, partial [Auricularia subglabra TFB-10046 SS5]